MYRFSLFLPYVLVWIFGTALVLLLTNHVAFGGDGIPLPVAVLTFMVMFLIAVACFRVGEPIILSRMLRRATQGQEGCGGVILRTSVWRTNAVVNGLVPIEGGYRARLDRADGAAAAGRRLVVVAAPGEFRLVTGPNGDRHFVTVRQDQVQIVDRGGFGVLEFSIAGRAPIVFEAVVPKRWRFARVSSDELRLQLSC